MNPYLFIQTAWLSRILGSLDLDLAYNVMNLTADECDEIVVWDSNHVWIYKQDRPFTGKKIYAPLRNPDYNESNYRVNVSMPVWK